MENLDEPNLQKFYLRMCGDKNIFSDFIIKNSFKKNSVKKQNINEFQKELLFVANSYNFYKNNLDEINSDFSSNYNLHFWQKAYIGQLDKIFPPQNQIAAWTSGKYKEKTEKILLNTHHYDFNLLQNILDATIVI